MKFAADGPMAIPLWINGRAYLTVTEGFVDVLDPASGEAVRRTPLAGAAEVAEALLAARAAQPAWATMEAAARQAALTALAALLDQYTGHFVRLLRQETGWDEARAQAEVAATVAALQASDSGPGEGVFGLISDAASPLAAGVARLARALRAGRAVIWKPSPRAPGAAFALAELSGRAAWPAGVFNLVHGDVAAMEALCAEGVVGVLEVCGEPGFLAQVEALAARLGRRIEVVSPT